MPRNRFGKATLLLPLLAAFALAPLAVPLTAPGAHAEGVVIPSPAAEVPAATGLQTAVIAGGCFWGVQAVYQHVKGVTNAVSGYAGGKKEDATYEKVGGGRTGHAEAVAITFDPRLISYGKILHIFFSVAHDPTELDRQGPDVGAEYRSEIFPQDEGQRQVATAYIAQLNAAKAYPEPIVTRVNAAKQTFYRAEAYHQDYAVRHPYNPYIVINDAPKVKNLKTIFGDLYRDKPVTVAQAEAKGG